MGSLLMGWFEQISSPSCHRLKLLQNLGFGVMRGAYLDHEGVMDFLHHHDVIVGLDHT